MGRIVAFVGPTIESSIRPRGEVIYMPPARHGDLFRLEPSENDIVVLIDGVYQHCAPLRHKEILAYLDKGVTILGAASMGALRAVELAPFGMIGIGRVYESVAAGKVTADADVAVLQDMDTGRRLTVAQISFRMAAAHLREIAVLPAEAEAALVQMSAEIHFTERSRPRLLCEANAAGLQSEMVVVLDYLSTRRGDVKTADALDAISTAVTGPHHHAASHEAAPSSWSTSYGLEWQLDCTPGSPSEVPRRLALACMQLFKPKYPELHKSYVHRIARATTHSNADATGLLSAIGFSRESLEESPWSRPTSETAHWTSAERILVRTFRLMPGRCIYVNVPEECTDGTSFETIQRWCEQLGARWKNEACFGRPGEWRRLLRELWGVSTDQDFSLKAAERGFRDEFEALRYASVFDPGIVRSALEALGET